MTGNSIVIVKKDNKIITCLADEKDIITIQLDQAVSTRIVGNIYLGKVKNIVKNINAAFVEIADRQVCYLPLTDNEHPVFANGESHPIRVGDELIVQIAKDAAKHKAPLATANFNLTGKYLVLVHGRAVLGISSKITDENRRKELKELLRKEITGDYGFVVRTNAENAENEVIMSELNRLVDDYVRLIEYGSHWTCFCRLYSAPPSYIWEIRDGYSDKIDKIITDDEEIYGQIQDYLNRVHDDDISKLTLYNDSNVSLSTVYGIEGKLKKALYEQVWLDSGAYLIIQPTEALVSIDVNTGKAIAGKQNTEETFYKVNCEAAEEIGRQIRLRNLSGIIIVDFIDMKDDTHKKLLLRRLKNILALDNIPSKLVDMTALNLVEITRKRIRKPLYEQIREISSSDVPVSDE